jgi:hypothetical protein
MTPVRPPNRNVTRKPTEQHRRLEVSWPLPHGADPVEELHPGRHRDQERHEREERQQHRAGGEHVVRPHRHRQRAIADRRADQALVAEERLAAEHRDDLGDDAEERQRDDVDLGMAEEPEQVLPQQRAAVRGVEDVRAEPPVRLQHQQRGGQDRERHQHQDRGDQDVPGEDRHPEHRHARARACVMIVVMKLTAAEDGAETGQRQAHDPQVGRRRRRVIALFSGA